ncbi:MAG: MGMT family protein [Candidatus Omnitrophota bacterium]|nr:MGMT family protein [Candidatus Omnitrophota bacterium]
MTEFERRVLKAVLKIPLGQTRTYKWVAEKAGFPEASRAVGQALNKNPYPIIIPCHRVVASGGKLGGYSRGVMAKKRLLNLEKKIYNVINSKCPPDFVGQAKFKMKNVLKRKR